MTLPYPAALDRRPVQLARRSRGLPRRPRTRPPSLCRYRCSGDRSLAAASCGRCTTIGTAGASRSTSRSLWNRSLHNRVIRSSHHDLASGRRRRPVDFPLRPALPSPLRCRFESRGRVPPRRQTSRGTALLQLGEHGEARLGAACWAMIRQRSRRPKNAWGRGGGLQFHGRSVKNGQHRRPNQSPAIEGSLASGCRRRDLRFVVLPKSG